MDTHPRLDRNVTRHAPLVAVLVVLALVVAAGGFWVERTVMEKRAQRTSADMHERLRIMRVALATYRARMHAGPRTLNDAVMAGLMLEIPVDPVTQSRMTWKLTLEENVRADDFARSAVPSSAPGIVDVHSGAPGKDARGKPWAEY